MKVKIDEGTAVQTKLGFMLTSFALVMTVAGSLATYLISGAAVEAKMDARLGSVESDRTQILSGMDRLQAGVNRLENEMSAMKATLLEMQRHEVITRGR